MSQQLIHDLRAQLAKAVQDLAAERTLREALEAQCRNVGLEMLAERDLRQRYEKERPDALLGKIGLLEAKLAEARFEDNLYRWRYRAVAHDLWGAPTKSSAPPPRETPASLRSAFTMQGRVPVEIAWTDNTAPDNRPLIYRDEEINAYIARVAAKDPNIYGWTDRWLWQALEKHPIANMRVAVIGSMSPWYEAACLYYRSKPTTIEYNKIIVRSARMQALTVAEFEANPQTFDAAINISSIEHDGLGAYGDPVNPDGDLMAMKKLKTYVRRGGLTYFAVPVGADKVIWNSARVYGRLRLPLLLEGWEVVDRFGYSEDLLDGPGHVQPVLVLRNL